MPLGLDQLALLAGGGILVAFGAWVLLHKRRARRERERLHIAGEELPGEPAPPRRLTEPTRLSIALCALVLGYHLIAWAFPPGLFAVQLNRQWWWVWCLVAAVIMVLSLVMDGIDERDPIPPDPPGPPRAG